MCENNEVDVYIINLRYFWSIQLSKLVNNTYNENNRKTKNKSDFFFGSRSHCYVTSNIPGWVQNGFCFTGIKYGSLSSAAQRLSFFWLCTIYA